MKSKNLTLLFLFGLFLFLSPNFVEAACQISCAYCAGTDNCAWAYYYNYVERVGFFGNIESITEDIWCPFPGWEPAFQDSDFSCSDSGGKCQNAAFPTGGYNGQSCTGMDRKLLAWPPGVCEDCSKSGNWDASDSDSGDGPACIQCSGKIESKWLGDTSEIYNNPCETPPAGDGQCESACGANSYIDEFPPGSCSTIECGYGNTKRLDCCDFNCNPSDGACESTCGADAACDGKYPGEVCASGITCTSDCRCPDTCTISGAPYDNGECNPSNKCEYCDISQSATDWSNVPSGQVCYSDNLVDVSDSSGRYCNYREDCSNGKCSAQEWWTSCDGSGSCRPSYDKTDAYIEDIIASNGYVLRLDCTETSASTSYYCETPEGTCITASTCNGSMLYRGCYNGSCSSSSTYGYNDTSDDSECDGLTCSTTNYCRSNCDWYTGKRCSDGSCTEGYGGGSCDPYTCSGSSCTSICSISCGAVCEDDGDCPGGSTCQANCTCSGVNNPPTCEAGSDKTVNENQSVQLDCFASDLDGDPLTYFWSCTGGSLNNPSILQPIYTAPSVTVDTDYTCTLNVDDGRGGNCSDSMVVHVQDVPSGEIITSPVVATIGDPTISEDPAHPGQYQAILTGYLDSLGFDSGTCPSCKCIVWFGWGTSGTPGNSDSYGNHNTPVEMTTEDDYFFYTADNLDPGTFYKFEAFAKNGGSW
jgi:hypothetical protein